MKLFLPLAPNKHYVAIFTAKSGIKEYMHLSGTKPVGGNPCSSPPTGHGNTAPPLSPGYCHEEEEEGKEGLEEEEEGSSPSSSIPGFVAGIYKKQGLTSD
jgi:hypothetical protein